MTEYRGAALRLLWWATLVELLLVRVVSRVGIFIPKTGTALAIYRALLAVGEVAFSFSLFMGVLLLALALAGHRWRAWAPAAAAGALVMVSPGSITWSFSVVLMLLLAVGVLGVRAVRACESPWETGTLTVVLTVHLLGYLVSAAQLGWEALALPGGAPLAGAALRAGELLAILAPVLLAGPLITGRRWGLFGAIGLGSAAALGAAYLANADITAILAMYSLGFTLSWPVAFYLVALACGVPGLLYAAKRDRHKGLALGLLFLAGYTPGVNQQHLLLLAAWALLALPTARQPAATLEVTPA